MYIWYHKIRYHKNIVEWECWVDTESAWSECIRYKLPCNYSVWLVPGTGGEDG